MCDVSMLLDDLAEQSSWTPKLEPKMYSLLITLEVANGCYDITSPWAACQLVKRRLSPCRLHSSVSLSAFNQFLNKITTNKGMHIRSKSTSDFFSLQPSRHPLSASKSSRNLTNVSVDNDLANGFSLDGSRSSKRNTVTFEDEHDQV